MKKLNNIYEECDEITSTNEDKKTNEKNSRIRKVEIKIFTEQINSKFKSVKSEWEKSEKIKDQIITFVKNNIEIEIKQYNFLKKQ